MYSEIQHEKSRIAGPGGNNIPATRVDSVMASESVPHEVLRVQHRKSYLVEIDDAYKYSYADFINFNEFTCQHPYAASEKR
jgi:hypothetical protein